MRSLPLTLVLAVGLLFTASPAAARAARSSPGDDLSLARREVTREGFLVSRSLEARDDGDGDDDGEVDDEENDYRAGVFERMSTMLDQIQPSVDQVQALSSQANDQNGDEYASKMSTHLGKIANAGDSLSQGLSSDGSSGSDARKRDVEPDCDTCEKKKKHYKPKYCHKCRKRKIHECAGLLWRWLKCCKICISAIWACKSSVVKEKCKDYVPKITKCCYRVVDSCGRHGIKASFQVLAQVDIASFSQMGLKLLF